MASSFMDMLPRHPFLAGIASLANINGGDLSEFSDYMKGNDRDDLLNDYKTLRDDMRRALLF